MYDLVSRGRVILCRGMKLKLTFLYDEIYSFLTYLILGKIFIMNLETVFNVVLVVNISFT